jgi:hypothetical protein
MIYEAPAGLFIEVGDKRNSTFKTACPTVSERYLSMSFAVYVAVISVLLHRKETGVLSSPVSTGNKKHQGQYEESVSVHR